MIAISSTVAWHEKPPGHFHPGGCYPRSSSPIHDYVVMSHAGPTPRRSRRAGSPYQRRAFSVSSWVALASHVRDGLRIFIHTFPQIVSNLPLRPDPFLVPHHPSLYAKLDATCGLALSFEPAISLQGQMRTGSASHRQSSCIVR
jgi:hypothetical protein